MIKRSPGMDCLAQMSDKKNVTQTKASKDVAQMTDGEDYDKIYSTEPQRTQLLANLTKKLAEIATHTNEEADFADENETASLASLRIKKLLASLDKNTSLDDRLVYLKKYIPPEDFGTYIIQEIATINDEIKKRTAQLPTLFSPYVLAMRKMQKTEDVPRKLTFFKTDKFSICFYNEIYEQVKALKKTLEIYQKNFDNQTKGICLLARLKKEKLNLALFVLSSTPRDPDIENKLEKARVIQPFSHSCPDLRNDRNNREEENTEENLPPPLTLRRGASM